MGQNLYLPYQNKKKKKKKETADRKTEDDTMSCYVKISHYRIKLQMKNESVSCASVKKPIVQPIPENNGRHRPKRFIHHHRYNTTICGQIIMDSTFLYIDNPCLGIQES
jgi:hypothetical protein